MSNGIKPDKDVAPTGTRREAIRWRWYHFYFLLAIFDLVVIAASLTLYHRTLTSYERALDGLSKLDARQHWITKLRLAVIELNAPGNDVFESRDVAAERARFESTRTRLRLLFRRDVDFRVDLSGVRNAVEAMEIQEEAIFASFEKAANSSPTEENSRHLLAAATVSMAAMDRHQAHAVAGLAAIEKTLQDEQSELLSAYGDQLQRSAAFEKYFLVIVVLILAGMFWYGRKLQRMHESMIENQQRAIAERHERLATVGEVCSAVSHGIRNPLAAITSSAQLALEVGTLDESTRLRLNDVLSESQRLNQRISRLLDFARGGESVNVTYDVCAVVRQAIMEVGPNLERKGIDLKSDIESVPINVTGNPDEFAQSVIELMSNAMDNIQDGGRITVNCRRDESRPGYVRISVIDDGPGIPMEIRERVFDLFFTTKSQGNGIGLASVKRTCESHDGWVCVHPSDGGTHIRAVLPIRRHG